MFRSFRSLFSKNLHAVPRSVWALGLVSMLMDMSSEMILSLLPVYLVTALGASTVAVGVIEGIAEATASISKVFSGILSDVIGKRKILAVIGYGLAAVAKPFFPLASSLGWIVGARFIDRVGKGIRGAPRDALMSDLTPPAVRGASFGLRQSLDTLGAFLGPLAAIGLMLLTADSYKIVFWFAVIPAFVSVALLMVVVREPEKTTVQEKNKAGFSWKALLSLNPVFWGVVIVASFGTLARFSEAFLILRVQHAGLDPAFMPLVFVVMNLVYALIAMPVGIISDRIGRQGLLAVGFAVLIVADAVLAMAGSLPGVFLGIVLWGVHMGMSQGLLSALVADTARADQRGTAFGVFNFVTGLTLLAASVLAGWLWEIHGPSATFMAGGVFAAVTLMGLLFVNRKAVAGNRQQDKA